MNYLSVCSGIEAASVAWHPLGWRPFAFSEIEKFPSRVLAHHYPDTPNFGDMTKFQEWPDATIDVLVGGTPCQSFSVAGLRAGLADPRGNLMLTYLAIAGKYRPRWLVWENVPGVLSSNAGKDFGALLGGLAELGYGFAYRILDAQYVRVDGIGRAVPQRRRRVFVVGCLGDWRRAAAVLFERESLRGNSAPSRKAGEVVTGTISSRTTGGGGLGTDFDLAGGLQQWPANVATTLDAHFGDKLGLENQHINGGARSSLPPVSLCLNAGAMGRIDAESETLTPTGGYFGDAYAIQSGALRENPSSGPQAIGVQRGVAYTIEARAEVQCVAHSLRAGGFDASEDGTGRGTPLVPIAFGWQNSSQQGASASASAEIAPTLDKSKTPAIAFAQNQRDEVRMMNVAGALAAEPGMKQQTYASTAMGVRRLTPRECERLQGFPLILENVRIDICLDHQNGFATAALSCRKWQNNASPADAKEWPQSALIAGSLLSTRQASQEPLAVVRVHTQSVDDLLEIRSHGRCLWSAQNARASSLSLQPTQRDSIARELALLGRDLALAIQGGRAELPLSIRLSTAASRGAIYAQPSGEGSAASVSDAASGAPAARFTTSALGATIPNCDSKAATSLCSVLAAISGCIPNETLPDCFSLELEIGTPYTLIPGAADGPRYKALGNSFAVNVVRWIGTRIAMVDAILQPEIERAA